MWQNSNLMGVNYWDNAGIGERESNWRWTGRTGYASHLHDGDLTALGPLRPIPSRVLQECTKYLAPGLTALCKTMAQLWNKCAPVGVGDLRQCSGIVPTPPYEFR